jgi:hypothetical protein
MSRLETLNPLDWGERIARILHFPPLLPTLWKNIQPVKGEIVIYSVPTRTYSDFRDKSMGFLSNKINMDRRGTESGM